MVKLYFMKRVTNHDTKSLRTPDIKESLFNCILINIYIYIYIYIYICGVNLRTVGITSIGYN